MPSAGGSFDIDRSVRPGGTVSVGLYIGSIDPEKIQAASTAAIPRAYHAWSEGTTAREPTAPRVFGEFEHSPGADLIVDCSCGSLRVGEYSSC